MHTTASPSHDNYDDDYDDDDDDDNDDNDENHDDNNHQVDLNHSSSECTQPPPHLPTPRPTMALLLTTTRSLFLAALVFSTLYTGQGLVVVSN